MSAGKQAGVPRRQADLVAILEVVYANVESAEAWLSSVLDALRQFYLGGEGCLGYFFERTGDRSMRFGSYAYSGLPDIYDEILPLALDDHSPEYIDAMFNCPAVHTLSRAMPVVGDRPRFQYTSSAAALNEAMLKENTKDILGLRAEDASGRGVVLAAPLSSIKCLERREVATLMRILSHVASGNRLISAHPDTAHSAPEAILTPAGRVEHAVGLAKENVAQRSLANAASRLDRARGRLRRLDPEAAVEEWKALVAGHWSLVDHIDSDGRRYLFARRNEHRPRNPTKQLSAREYEVAALAALGHSNKLIAYELGLQTSTVSAYLWSVFNKLGVASRVQLVRAMAPWTADES